MDDDTITAELGQIGVDVYDYYEIDRCTLYFDTSALGSEVIVTDAILKLRGNWDSLDDDFDITIQNGQPTYPHSPQAAADFNQTYYSGNGGSYNTSNFYTNSTYNQISLNATGLGWINQTGTTKFMLRSSKDIGGDAPDDEGEEMISYYTYEQGSSYRPLFVVTYEEPGPPSPPEDVVASNGTCSIVRITWTPSKDNRDEEALGYNIYRSTSNDSNTASYIGTSTPDYFVLVEDVLSIYFDDTTTTIDTYYYYWVKGYNEYGYSGYSSSDLGYRNEYHNFNGYYWQQGISQLFFYVDSAMSSESEAAWRAAADLWDDAPYSETGFTEVYTTPTYVNCVYSNNEELPWSGRTTFDVTNNIINRVYVYINEYQTDEYITAKQYSVATHEYGHVLGMNHYLGPFLMDPSDHVRYDNYGIYYPTVSDVDEVNLYY